jgi:hypothetical protein
MSIWARIAREAASLNGPGPAILPVLTVQWQPDPMSEADPMEEMHLAPRFSVAEG